jgi:tetratricopeptide (TPR) repeat protein
MYTEKETSMPSQTQRSWTDYGSTALWALIFGVSFAWWRIAGQGLGVRTVLIAALSLAAFMVGCLVGFLFTSYGEEAGTVGKIRDWLIGGITGLTIAKAASIKGLLATFQATSSGTGEYALTVSAAIVYTSLGFFFMFFQRELVLNVLLAEGRAQRGRVDGTSHAGQVVKSFLLKLPASLLSGVDDVDEITAVDKEEAKNLHETLYSDDVKAFLQQAERSLSDGLGLDWDVISKVAYIHYYRTYFEKKDDKPAQARRAIDWITRALVINPQHADFTLKLADMMGTIGDYEAAVTILERLVRQPDGPIVVRQWLGFFLLNVPGRLADAVRYSEEYSKLVGEDADSLFNLASAYAQAFCENVPDLGPPNETHEKALTYLRRALQREPDYAETIRTKWIEKGESFACFVSDKEFRMLAGLDTAPATQNAGDIRPAN